MGSIAAATLPAEVISLLKDRTSLKVVATTVQRGGRCVRSESAPRVLPTGGSCASSGNGGFRCATNAPAGDQTMESAPLHPPYPSVGARCPRTTVDKGIRVFRVVEGE